VSFQQIENSCWCSERSIGVERLSESILDYYESGVSNEFIHKAPTLTGRSSTVSTDTHTSHLSGDACIHRFQTALHSVLSTRVMLHTATVLRQDLIDSQATVTQNQCSNSIRFAEVTMELVSEDVELEETQR